MDRFHNALFIGSSAGVAAAVSGSRLTRSLANAPRDKTPDARSDKHHADERPAYVFCSFIPFQVILFPGRRQEFAQTGCKGFSFELRVSQQSFKKSRLLDEHVHTRTHTRSWHVALKNTIRYKCHSLHPARVPQRKMTCVSPSHTQLASPSLALAHISDFFFFSGCTLIFYILIYSAAARRS